MIKIYLLPLLFIIFFPILIWAQTGYIVKDSITYAGIKLINGGEFMNSRFCQVKEGDKIVSYSPYEVNQYGFRDGCVYISKEIQISDSIKKVFLERLAVGKMTIYYYRGKRAKTFFIEKENSFFIELPKQDGNDKSYNEQLLGLTNDCKNVFETTNFVAYNKKSLSKFIALYNKCELKPFPHSRFGITVGYELIELVPPEYIKSGNFNYFDFYYDGGFTIGLFLDNPIFVSDFSLHSEFYFSQHGFSYNKTIDSNDFDFVANFSSFKVPLLLRYECPFNKLRPFINLGMVGSLNIKNDSFLHKTIITENNIEIYDIEKSSLIDDILIGYCIGSGIEYKLNFRHSFFFEIRYCNQYGISLAESMNISGFQFTTSVNL